MRGLLIIASLAFGAGVAYFIPGEGPTAVLLCAFVALPVAFLIRRAGEDGALLCRVFVAALLVRLLVATAIYVFEVQEFFGGDAITYDQFGYMVLEYWRGAIDEDIYQEFVLPYLSKNWGMIYLTAVVYGVVGRNSLAVQFFNSVVGAATSAVIYHCALHIFRNVRVARLSLLFVAFWPSLVLWSAQGLKDGPIMLLLAVVFLTYLKLAVELRFGHCVVLACALLCLLSLRFYLFYIVTASIVGAYVMALRPSMSTNLLRQFVAIAAVGVALAVVGVTRTAGSDLEFIGNLETVQRSRQDQARFNSGYGKDLDVSTTSGAVRIIPLGTAYLLFAPFPWELSNVRQAITLPEMLVWWSCFPLLVIGVWYAIKFRLRESLAILLFTTMLTLAYAVFQANVGTAYRQRSQLMEFYFIYVSVGFVLLKERKENRERLRLLAARQLAARAQMLRRSRSARET